MGDKPGTSAPKDEKNSADNVDVVQKCMGIYGRWHLWMCFLLFLGKFSVGWHQLNIVIFAPKAKFTCSDNKTDPCASNCTSHEFDKSLFTNTIVTQWDLVCTKKVLADMAQTITMLGILVGNILFGYWSDKQGRKYPLSWAIVLQLISGVLTAFVPWYWLLLIGRFVVALATGGTMSTSFVLLMELVGTKWRTVVGTLYHIPFNIGHLSLALIGYIFRDWRYGELAISIPSALLISYFWLLPESPRWLIAAGKEDKAIPILQKAARINKLPTENIEADIKAYADSRKGITVKKGSMRDLFKTKNIRTRTLCMCFNWITTGLCFYGVAQHIGQLGGNIFLNITVSAAIQIPGCVISIPCLEKMGRKITLITFNLISGIPILIVPFLPENHWSVAVLYATTMFGLIICFCTVYIYTGELFPTVIRTTGIGTASMCARFGSILAPHVGTVGLYTYFYVPYLIFGLFPIFGAILCIWLPETLHCILPDTIEEAENFGSKPKTEKT